MKERIGKSLSMLILVTIIAGCAIIPGEKASNDTFHSEEMQNKALYYESILPSNPPYLYSKPFVPNRLTKQQLIQEYQEWKSVYVVDAGNGMLRVQRDAGSDYDTVSEGIGYGMLLAVYFNDQATFDGLYKYAKAHFHQKGLMHWKVRADGVNTSEFNLPVPHKIVWKNTNTGNIVEANTNLSAENGWVRLSWYTRGYTSATDADVDMALALGMAYKLWGSSANYNYETEAKTLMENILNYDMGIGFNNNNELFLYPGTCVNNGWSGIWGGKAGWNPSYFTPAWYKIFEKMTGDTRWSDLSTKIYQEISKIEAVNNNTGLLPDWCDTTGTTPKAPSGTISGSYSGASDILVNVIEETNNGRIVTNYYTNQPGKMSYNFYYDAIRVLWRMAVAVSWFGDEKARNIVIKQNQFFRNKFYLRPQGINNIKDGYSIDGSAWNIANKDALNDAVGGQWTTSPFIAMVATSLLVAGDYDYSVKLFNALVNSKTPYTEKFHYYGNTLRLLALLYLSGEFPNLFETTITGDTNFKTLPRIIQAEKFTMGGNINIVSDTTAEEGSAISLTGGEGWINFNVEVLTNWRYKIISYGYPSFVGESFVIECRVKSTSGGKIVVDTTGSPCGRLIEINVPSTGGSWQTISLANGVGIPLGKNTILFKLTGSDLMIDSITLKRPATNILIPGYFEAEDFNLTKDCNIWDVGVSGSGGTESAQWAEYYVKIAKPGTYNIISKATYYGGGHRVEILKNGVILGTMVYPSLWKYEGIVLSNISLSEGIYTLRINYANAPRNIDYFNFKLVNSFNIPAKIEAENYNTMSNANTGIWDGVTTVSGGNGGTSYWVEYDINVPQSRSYNLKYRVKSLYYNSHKLSFATNGIVISTIDVPESDWIEIQTTVNLSAGSYPIRIYSNGGRYSFDWFELQ
ncbi:MAG: glycosyl hydrolase family 8 [Brevinematia bacterium]